MLPLPGDSYFVTLSRPYLRPPFGGLALAQFNVALHSVLNAVLNSALYSSQYSTITLLIRLHGKTGCRDGECSLNRLAVLPQVIDPEESGLPEGR